VIAGFFAGCGWLIMLGGIGVAAGARIGPHSLDLLADSSVQLRLLAAAGFVASAAALTRRLPAVVVLPGLAAAALVLYNAAAMATGFTPAAARADRWLVTLAEGALWPPVAFADLALVDWRAVGVAAVYLPAVVVLSVITVLMNAGAIELALRRDFDLDHELRSAGFQNLGSGAGGGLPGFHSVPLSLLSARLRASSPGAGLIAALLCAGVIAFGDAVFAVVPTPLLGAIVAWVGIMLMIDWLVRAWPRLPLWEFLVLVLIFLTMAATGLVWGLVVGLVAAAVLFVVEYGRVEIVRNILTGRDYQSGNDSSEERRRLLQAAGEAILIVRLQGFLFFGTAERVRQRIQHHVKSTDGAPIRYLVIDFRRVSGLDSSTVMSLTRLAQLTVPDRFVLVLCGMADGVRTAMARGGFATDADSQVRLFDDLDHALEWCENDLLASIAPGIAAIGPVPAIDLLIGVLKDRTLAETLLPYLERLKVATGDRLIEQGAPSSDIFFVEDGRAAVMLASGNERVQLATIGSGAIVGEMAFYLGKARSASVVAEAPLVVWRLSAENLARLEAESPATLIRFHRGMAEILAQRLAGANRLVRLLAD
jgi:SulP family sulfate permease